MAGLSFRELERLSYRSGKEDEPQLSNIKEALALLSKEDASVVAFAQHPPEIRYGRGPTVLTQECWNEIHTKGYVEGKPQWGYVSLYEFVLSRKGLEQLRRWEKEEEDAAKQLLIPGVHGWSSLWHYRGIYSVSRDGDVYDRGLVFTNPMDEGYIVFLGRKAVEPYKMDFPSSYSLPFTFLGSFTTGCDTYERTGFVFDIGQGKCRIYYPGTNSTEECDINRIPTNLVR